MKIFETIKMRWVVWAWNHTPNCAEMARLTSRSLDVPLSRKLRIQMRLHHWICVWCRRYFEQLHFLHTAAPRLGIQMTELAQRGLSADAKRRLLLAIADRRGNQP